MAQVNDSWHRVAKEVKGVQKKQRRSSRLYQMKVEGKLLFTCFKRN
jgi:hypothetical protein